MSDSVLSQDELDALLQGSSIESNDSGTLSSAEETVLTTLFNSIGKERANILERLTGNPVSLEQVNLLTGTSAKITEDLTTPIIGAPTGITGSMTGDWIVLAPESSVIRIGNDMLNSEATEINEEITDAFKEALSNSIASDILLLNNTLKIELGSTAVESKLYNNGSELITSVGSLLRIGINLTIDGASYPFYIVTSINFAKNIVKIMTPSPSSTNQNTTTSNESTNNSVNMTPAQFQQFNVQNVEPLDNLALLLDVPMRVTVELGRTRMTIKDILNLGEGSIVELEKLAGEPVDVLVNDKLIALGEVVIIDENFSVRVTKVVTPMERIFDRENLHGKGGV